MYPEVGEDYWGRPDQEDTPSQLQPAKLISKSDSDCSLDTSQEEIHCSKAVPGHVASNADLLPFLVPEQLQVPQAAVKLSRLTR